jgi:hypothetical protein
LASANKAFYERKDIVLGREEFGDVEVHHDDPIRFESYIKANGLRTRINKQKEGEKERSEKDYIHSTVLYSTR